MICEVTAWRVAARSTCTHAALVRVRRERRRVTNVASRGGARVAP